MNTATHRVKHSGAAIERPILEADAEVGYIVTSMSARSNSAVANYSLSIIQRLKGPKTNPNVAYAADEELPLADSPLVCVDGGTFLKIPPGVGLFLSGPLMNGDDAINVDLQYITVPRDQWYQAMLATIFAQQ